MTVAFASEDDRDDWLENFSIILTSLCQLNNVKDSCTYIVGCNQHGM